MKPERTKLVRSAGAIAVAVIVSALAACGSSGNGSTSGKGSKTSSAKPSGKAITVAINTPVASDYGDFPGSVAAVKASARAINASGGINGHPVRVVTCKTQGDPNLEAGCAQKAVDAGAVATINSFIISNPNGYLNELKSHSVADIASEIVQPQFAQASNVFPVTFGFGAFAACTSQKMASVAGGDRVTTYISQLPSAKALKDLMITGANAQHTKWVGSAGTPASVTDWSPIVQQVANLKPDIVIPGGGAQQFAPFLLSAVGSGHRWHYCSFGSGNLAKRLLPVGAAGDDFYDGNALPTLASENTIPALKTFRAQLEAEQKAGDSDAAVDGEHFDWEMLQAWVGMQVFKQVATSIKGSVTPTTFMSALKTTKFSGLGIVSPINFAAPQTYGSFTRVFNPYTYLEQWKSSEKQFVVIPGSKVNGAAALFGPAK